MGGVGKTAITTRFVKSEFSDEYDPTIEDFYQKQVEVDGRAAILEILDTAGNEQFKMMRDLYLGNSDAYVVVYSIVAQSTFSEVPQLLEDVKRIKPDRKVAPAILVGNKCDLPDSEREVTMEDGKSMALKYDCMFREASAKSNIGITEIFMDLSKNLVLERGKAGGKSKSEGGGGCCTLL